VMNGKKGHSVRRRGEGGPVLFGGERVIAGARQKGPP